MSSEGLVDVSMQFLLVYETAYACHPDSDIVTMYDTAWRQQLSNDDLAIQTFSANARTGNWKAAQQVRIYAETNETGSNAYYLIGCRQDAQTVSGRPLPLLERVLRCVTGMSLN